MTSKKQIRAAADATARKIADLLSDTADIGARLCRTNPDHDGYGDCDDDCDIEILHGLAIAVITAVEWLHPDGRRSTQTITADGQSFTADVGLTYLTLQELTR